MSLFDVIEETTIENETDKSRFKEYVKTDIDTIFSTPSKEWFVKYEPLDKLTEYRVHPGAEVVESYPLNFVKPPMPNENDIRIPDNGELTTVQLDALRLASSRFQKSFPESGVTKGFLLGDGPGLGKTRILAAIIYNEYLKGHKRHVFLSISDILFQDILNEFEKISSAAWAGAHVRNLEHFDTTLRLQEFRGVLFMTYHRLRKPGQSSPTPSKTSRLSGVDVIKVFCGREKPFRGVIAFDESHVGKNALNPIMDLQSTTGKEMLKVLGTYKNAKVVYSTATPASNPNQLAIMSRLGIWGPQKYYSNFEKFYKLMSKWELAAAEYMTLKLKQEGAMVCRQISFEGVITSAEYLPSDYEPPNYRENYNQFSDMWRKMYQDVVIIASYCDTDSKKTKIATFYSALMNFFRALIIDSKIDFLVERIRKEIANGHVVVIGIQGTGEASYADHDRYADRTDLISNAKEIMEKLVRNHFCVAKASRLKKRKRTIDSPDITVTNNVDQIAVDTPNFGNVLENDLDISSSDDESNKDGGLQNEQESQAAVAVENLRENVSDNPQRPPLNSGRENVPENNSEQALTGTNNTLDTENAHPNPEEVQAATTNENTFGNGLHNNEQVPTAVSNENGSQNALHDLEELTSDGNENVAVATILCDGLECLDIAEVNSIRERWLSEIEAISNAPPNFLDEIKEKLRKYNNITVAEITGRRLHMVPKEDKYQLVDRLVDCDSERQEFMEGKANVAIISDAGSTGISLHASNAKDEYCKSLRVHITVELGWSAEKVLQQLGRTHRANQRQPPRYQFLFSNVPAEIRFTSIILGRLSTMSTFTCAQRHFDLSNRLDEQGKFDSNAGIRGIRAALAFFFDEDVPIPYEKDVELKYKVLTQLGQYGLKSTKDKNRFAKTQGRTLKRVNLTKIMNKLLGCTLDVQEVFCDVWLFYLLYYKEQYTKDQGVIVIPPSLCQIVLDEKVENLTKHEKAEGVIIDNTNVEGEQSENLHLNIDSEPEENGESADTNQLNNANETLVQGIQNTATKSASSHANKQARPATHEPVFLLGLHAFLGSTVGAVKKMHDSTPESDKISGFYHDGGFPGLHHLRYFYLANKCLSTEQQHLILTKKELSQDLLDSVVCELYQPHQPPIDLTGQEVIDFVINMSPILSSIALDQWKNQASFLKDSCIHKYSLGDCDSPNCVTGVRHSLKYMVEGDLPAIWPDIVSTLQDEDPSIIVCKDFLTGQTHIGVEIPKYSITALKLKVNGHDYYSLGTDNDISTSNPAM